jgi:hypothetical protein
MALVRIKIRKVDKGTEPGIPNRMIGYWRSINHKFLFAFDDNLGYRSDNNN